MNARTFAVIALAGLIAAPLVAQVGGTTAELGLARSWAVTSDQLPATVLLPSISVDRSRWRFDAAMTGAVGTSHGEETRGSAAAEWLGPHLGPFRSELAGDVTTPIGAFPGINATAGARFHLSGASRGTWLGLGYAEVGTAGTIATSVGGWWSGRLGSFSVRLENALGGNRSTTFMQSDTLPITHSVPRIHAQSAVARFVEASGRVELSLIANRIAAPGADRRTRMGATGTWWMRPTFALTAGYGTPMDRWAIGRQGRAQLGFLFRPRFAPPHPSTLGERAAAAEVRRLEDGRWQLRIPAPGADQVEVQGTPTDWEPRALTRVAGGWWETTLDLPPGRHELTWRRDAGAWTALPGLPTARDGLLGDVTVVVVE